MASEIVWPTKYMPGTTDNFVSNEVYVKGLTAPEIWPYLANMTKWESYYDNVGQLSPPKRDGEQLLQKGDRFSFSTFGFPPLQSEVMESVPPSSGGQRGGGGREGRLAWRAWQEGGEDEALDVYHAWIVEDMPWGVVRILTQESQIGKPAAELAGKKPNPMLNGHQDWLDGLVKIARDRGKAGKYF